MNDLMHMSLKQIQMLTAFDKYNLLLLYDNNHYIYILKYVVKEINLLFFKCVQMFFAISLRGNIGWVTVRPPHRHARARPLTCFSVMVLLNFYLLILIQYYFTASFDMFYRCFCL
jgi:hypothetical protein